MTEGRAFKVGDRVEYVGLTSRRGTVVDEMPDSEIYVRVTWDTWNGKRENRMVAVLVLRHLDAVSHLGELGADDDGAE